MSSAAVIELGKLRHCTGRYGKVQVRCPQNSAWIVRVRQLVKPPQLFSIARRPNRSQLLSQAFAAKPSMGTEFDACWYDVEFYWIGMDYGLICIAIPIADLHSIMAGRQRPRIEKKIQNAAERLPRRCAKSPADVLQFSVMVQGCVILTGQDPSLAGPIRDIYSRSVCVQLN